MLERLYIDNVRSFVNFEWRPDRLSVLLGPNGAGKTRLFEVLFALRSFVMGDVSVGQLLPASSSTRWSTRTTQTIELDVALGGALHRYRLVVEQDPGGLDDPLVALERLEAGALVVEASTPDLAAHRSKPASTIPGTRPTRSAVGSHGGEAFVSTFLAWMNDVWLLRPDPRAMSERVDRRRVHRAPSLAPSLSNFASWYVPTLARSPRDMQKAIQAVEPALPGLVELRDGGGELEAVFERDGKTTAYTFDELSDGERALISDYVILHVVARPGSLLLIDEPDNYLGLREVQPWVNELCDRVLQTGGPQVFLVSHHPDVLNLLAPDRGFRLFRDQGGPTRIDRFAVDATLSPGELVSRGWDGPT